MMREIIANALNKKIIPMDTSNSFGLTLITCETAAIAVAPQIAVPEDIRRPNLKSILKIFANNIPTRNMIKT